MKVICFLLSAVCLHGCAVNSDTANKKNTLVFDSSGVELMQRNKALLKPWLFYTLTVTGCSKSSNGSPKFSCELISRDMLLDNWASVKQQDSSAADEYLDSLISVRESGFLREYVWRFLHRGDWSDGPSEERLRKFDEWAVNSLQAHKVETHLLGAYQ